jgi:hypothetical protein
VTEQGYGKRTELEEYRVQSRGGIGIINIQTSERNGKVIGIAQVHDEDELMLITQEGKFCGWPRGRIRSIGRATQGVRLIDIEGEDRAVSIARLAEKDEKTRSRTRRRGIACDGARRVSVVSVCCAVVSVACGPAIRAEEQTLLGILRCRADARQHAHRQVRHGRHSILETEGIVQTFTVTLCGRSVTA